MYHPESLLDCCPEITSIIHSRLMYTHAFLAAVRVFVDLIAVNALGGGSEGRGLPSAFTVPAAFPSSVYSSY